MRHFIFKPFRANSLRHRIGDKVRLHFNDAREWPSKGRKVLASPVVR